MVHDQQVIDTLTVPTNKIKTQISTPPSSATRTTRHTLPIDRISDGHGRLTEAQIAQLRTLHDEIPTREGHWCHDLEGSYTPVAELVSVDHLGRRWLFNDHGHRTLKWDDHCNRGHPVDLAGERHHAHRPRTAVVHAGGAP